MAGKVESLLRDFGWAGFGISVALAIDYLFYLLAGRLLGPAEFGIFGVIMSFYYIAVRSPFSIIELTARKIETDKLNVFSQLGSKAIYLGLVAFLGFIAISPLLSKFLEIPLKPFLIFCLIFPVAYITSVGTGSLQGSEKFKQYAVFEIFSSIFKFLAVILIVAGLGISGAVMAPVIEMFAGFAVVYYYLRPKLSPGNFQYKNILFKSAIVVFAVNMAFNIDLILLKIFQSSETVGLYYSVAVVGKAMIFGSAAVNKAVFPKFNGKKDDLKLLATSLGLIAAGALVAVFAFELFGQLFMRITFGSEYIEATSFASVYMIFISLVAACAAVGNYYLSVEKENLKLLLLLPILQVLLILIFHQNVFEVIYSGIAAGIVTLLVMLKPLR